MTQGFGATIFGCEGPSLQAEEARFFRQVNPFGFILFARNVENPEQVQRLTRQLRDAAGHDTPIFVDQEGGRVQRLRAPHWREWQPALDMTGLFGPDREAAQRAVWLRYRIIAAELHAVGIDANCAPCLDTATPATHPVLRNRCLSDDPVQVAALGRAAVAAHLAGGVLPVIKHMPGQGRGALDSHHDLPHVAASLPELAMTDFLPFRSLSDAPLGMSGHVVYDEIDPVSPATTSATVINLIRNDFGFQGLLMTDDLSMNALSGDVVARVTASLAAGIDVILHCNGALEEMVEVAAAASGMTPAAKARAERALAARQMPEPVDITALEAELSNLLDGRVHV